MLSIWLEEFFLTFGDHAPNDETISLSLVHKKNAYQQYVTEMSESIPKRPYVSLPRFIAVWNVTFPNCKCRTFVDVPGKCDICYEIDRQRKACPDAHTQRKLTEAHNMHRGGMFMKERRE